MCWRRTALCRRCGVSSLASSCPQQARAELGVRGDVDGSPGEPERSIDDCSVGLARDAVGSKLRLMVHGGQRVNANHGVDRRECQRYVAHIRGASRTQGCRVGEHAAQGLGVATVDSSQLSLMVHFRIGFLAPNNIQHCTRGQGSGFKTAHDFGPDLIEVGERLARTIYLAAVWAGMIFGASPPLVTIPWIRSVDWICCRSNPMAIWAMVRASAALMPCSG